MAGGVPGNSPQFKHKQLSIGKYDKLPLAFFWLDSRLAFAFKQSTGRLLYGQPRQGPNKDYFTPQQLGPSPELIMQ